jgi:hypothetical protein
MNDDLFGYLREQMDGYGPETAYLGHFFSMHNLCQGHNDVDDDADQVDKTVAALGAGRAEQNPNAEPEGA